MKIAFIPFKVFSLLFILIAFYSCKKLVDIDPSANLINSETVFISDGTAIAAINGVYAQMRQLNNSMTNGGLSLFTGLSGDEIYNTSASLIYDPFFKDSIPPENVTINRNFWTEAYSNIYKVNAIIEGLSKSTSLTVTVKNQLLGEAKFIRSFYYLYLVNLFGDVPLITTTDYRLNEKMPRTAVAQVYQQITSDLLDAENYLIVTYPSSGKARANKWTAISILARVYLYQKNWLEAEAKSSAIINSGVYNLVSNLSNVFLKSNSETIWEIEPRNASGNTVEGANFIPSSSTVKPGFALTSHLLNSFESGDQRRSVWTKSNTLSGVVYYYPYKYKIRSSTTVNEHNIVLRLAEQYLIRSEARAQQGNLFGCQADLNVIRNRAGLPNTPAVTQQELLLAIEQERKIEFFSEWGHRWFDLKRTGKINEVLSSQKPFWKPFSALYPIPFSQIQLNLFLSQNPGY